MTGQHTLVNKYVLSQNANLWMIIMTAVNNFPDPLKPPTQLCDTQPTGCLLIVSSDKYLT